MGSEIVFYNAVANQPRGISCQIHQFLEMTPRWLLNVTTTHYL